MSHDIMQSQPQREHEWLHKLVGEWIVESECKMGPDQPTETMRGVDRVRSFGGLWVLCEGSAETPGGNCDNLMTLGFDPAKGRFVGTFIASVMSHLWLYEGTLDAAGRVLTLDTEGPSFSGDGTTVKYQDIIEWHDDGHRTLSSQLLGPDGTWQRFMTAHYRRK